MAGLTELIIGIVLFFVGIGMTAGAFVWKSRADPTIGWTWGMILLLVSGIVIAIVGVALVIIGSIRRKKYLFSSEIPDDVFINPYIGKQI